MPLYPEKKPAIRAQLEKIAAGQRVSPIEIGSMTAEQFAAINAYRSHHGMPTLERAVVMYLGRHHYNSRSKDHYTIDDMIEQLESGLSASAIVEMGMSMTALQNVGGREDAYGRVVRDRVILELMARKPNAEALSAIPKGDQGGPAKNKKPLV